MPSTASGEDMAAPALIALHTGTFLAWTLGVAALTWWMCRRSEAASGSASDDYFAGGRSLRWYIVAGSLMLTNLSTEQLVGLNGAVFADGCLAGIWWEAGAAVAMIATAVVFLPRYMALGLTTTSGFLGERYDIVVRTVVAAMFLLYYALLLCPAVLYTGALAIRSIFELHAVPLWAISSTIGLVGSIYAILGGLRAVAVSDSLNGLGLVALGVWVPVAAIRTLPDGLSSIFEHRQYLRPLVARSHIFDDDSMTRSLGVPSLPWHATLTGLTLANMYCWSTSQLIVQRVLAAQSLAHGQKGVLFAAAMKVIGFSFLCLPGVIAIVMVESGVVVNGQPFKIRKADEAFPELVKVVMPTWSLGLFSAVLLGSVLSTFNSALNSASTLFSLEVYKVFIEPGASDQRVVRVATIFGTSLALVSFVLAPQLVHASSIFGFMRRVNTIVSLPILTVFLVGIATSLPDAPAAKLGFTVAAVSIGLGQLIPSLHYLHLFFACFVLSVACIAMVTYIPAVRRAVLCKCGPPTPYEAATGAAKVNTSPWRALYAMVAVLVGLLITLGLALQLGSAWLFCGFWVIWALATAALVALPAKDWEHPCSPQDSCEATPGSVVQPAPEGFQ